MRRLALPLALFLAAPLGAEPTFAPPSERVLKEAMASAKRRPVAERLELLTRPLVGAPYVLSPLGEGSGPDPDPRLRYDAFDCTTFVETAIAMSRVDDPSEVSRELDAIRYGDGTPTFERRRHFPEAEWLPGLERAGLITDITREVAGDEAAVAKKTLDLSTWKSRKNKALLKELPDARIPQGTFSVDIWPLDLAIKGAARIPEGTVLSVVREDYRSVPVRISHQGLVVKRDGRLFMRHAADRMFHRVVDEPLESFLLRIKQYRKWPVSGIHLDRVEEPKAAAPAK